MPNPTLNRLIQRATGRIVREHPPILLGDFFVVDCARSRQIYGLIQHEDSENCLCLYDGQLPHRLAQVAPYLVRLDPSSLFTRKFLTDGWGNAWGIIIRSSDSLQDNRRHLRKFTYVIDDRNRKLLFRFYDPRVFRAFLPTCNQDQLNMIFGAIDSFVIEHEDPRYASEFQFVDDRLRTRKIEIELT